MQQTFEKYAKVKVVNMEVDATEGSVQFENAAVCPSFFSFRENVLADQAKMVGMIGCRQSFASKRLDYDRRSIDSSYSSKNGSNE